ncbi:MAG: DRTGG domain-containing protein, partial [Dehalococcoidales bacterium]
ETSSRCLVLSGDTPLNPTVLDRAEEKDIPIILTGDDSATVAASIEDALLKNKFHQENKLARLTELMEQHLDIQAIKKRLG